MRYYRIDITQTNGQPYLFKSLSGYPLSSLLPNGNPNRAALTVEFDLPVTNVTTPNNNCWLRIWGLGLQDLGNAADLNDLNISIYAGMSKGLPLANPAQSGLIIQGQIFQAFGNWVGTDQTLDLNIISGGNAGTIGSPDTPGNYPFLWPAGSPLAAAIAQTLKTALPGLTQSINISPNLVLSYTQAGHYQSREQFADFIARITQPITGTAVQIAVNGASVTVWDGSGVTSQTPVKQIAFQDMIGQPTWIDALTISVKFVLRADLNISSVIQLPPSLVTQTQQSLLRFRDKSTFSGAYQILQVQHFGNSRQPDAASWNTTIQATPAPNATQAPTQT